MLRVAHEPSSSSRGLAEHQKLQGKTKTVHSLHKERWDFAISMEKILFFQGPQPHLLNWPAAE